MSADLTQAGKGVYGLETTEAPVTEDEEYNKSRNWVLLESDAPVKNG